MGRKMYSLLVMLWVLKFASLIANAYEDGPSGEEPPPPPPRDQSSLIVSNDT